MTTLKINDMGQFT